MKVVHLMTHASGGAARAALNLHAGLRARGVDSSILLGPEAPEADGCMRLHPTFNLPEMFGRSIRRFLTRFAFRPYRRFLRSSGGRRWERFSASRLGWGTSAAYAVRDADIVHLHWVADFLDLKTFFPALGEGAKVVWTLHDAWPFTGGCHFPQGCRGYENACGCCPQWGSTSPEDYSHRAWKDRSVAYRALNGANFRVVSPSCWLADAAKNSALFSQDRIEVIPNGINLEGFCLVDRDSARDRLGVSRKAYVLLFLADSGGNRRKGLDVLQESLAFSAEGERVLLVAGDAKPERISGWTVKELGYLREAEQLSSAYSAADVFVHPAIEDNLPSTVIESLACGTPVAGFRIGGLPDVITTGDLGFLAGQTTSAALRSLLSDGSLWHSDMTRRMTCRSRAEEFSISVMAGGYCRVYDELLAGRRA